jgi:hypothetical protein
MSGIAQISEMITKISDDQAQALFDDLADTPPDQPLSEDQTIAALLLQWRGMMRAENQYL